MIFGQGMYCCNGVGEVSNGKLFQWIQLRKDILGVIPRIFILNFRRTVQIYLFCLPYFAANVHALFVFFNLSFTGNWIEFRVCMRIRDHTLYNKKKRHFPVLIKHKYKAITHDNILLVSSRCCSCVLFVSHRALSFLSLPSPPPPPPESFFLIPSFPVYFFMRQQSHKKPTQ